jgi:hypothetical protein
MLAQSHLGRRIIEILMKGISTRNYQAVLPEMAETVIISNNTACGTFVEGLQPLFLT